MPRRRPAAGRGSSVINILLGCPATVPVVMKCTRTVQDRHINVSARGVAVALLSKSGSGKGDGRGAGPDKSHGQRSRNDTPHRRLPVIADLTGEIVPTYLQFVRF
jgi:hypothetical protein